MPVIRITDKVWRELQARAQPLVDSPNSVLERILGISPQEKKEPPPDVFIEVPISSTLSMFRYYMLPFPQHYRSFFPGYRLPMLLETDVGVFETHVTSAPDGTEIGDPKAGRYIQKNLPLWFANHRNLEVGDKLRFEVLEPKKRYRLTVIPAQELDLAGSVLRI